MKRLRYIGKTLKQDVTDQKTSSKLVTKQGVTKCNNETSSFFFYKPISVSKQMKRLRYIGKTLKQDVTDQKTSSKLVTKQGVTKCNNETSSFFFFL